MAIRNVDGDRSVRGSDGPAPPSDRVIERPTVLVVDDDADTRRSLVGLLEHYLPGTRVAAVRNGTEGLRHLERHPVACVVTDMQMPGIDGLGFIVRARAAGHFMPFMLASGALDGARLELAYNMVGLANVFRKPHDMERLTERVVGLVATHVPRTRR